MKLGSDATSAKIQQWAAFIYKVMSREMRPAQITYRFSGLGPIIFTVTEN